MSALDLKVRRATASDGRTKLTGGSAAEMMAEREKKKVRERRWERVVGGCVGGVHCWIGGERERVGLVMSFILFFMLGCGGDCDCGREPLILWDGGRREMKKGGRRER